GADERAGGQASMAGNILPDTFDQHSHALTLVCQLRPWTASLRPRAQGHRPPPRSSKPRRRAPEIDLQSCTRRGRLAGPQGAIMPVNELNHYPLRANDLERTKDFYVNVLGFEVMPRPDFPFPGYWLGISGKIQVHMGQAGVPNSELYYLGSPKNASKSNSGVIDHVAFLATEPEKF